MQIKMKKNNSRLSFLLYIFLFTNFNTIIYSEIMHLTGCKNLKDVFIKNEYILDFEKSLMIRNYIYDNKTYKKLRITDLSIKKNNTLERFIYKEKNLIFTDKIGYPQFYTQLVFEIDSPVIEIKTVINNEEGNNILSTCKKVERFDKES